MKSQCKLVFWTWARYSLSQIQVDQISRSRATKSLKAQKPMQTIAMSISQVCPRLWPRQGWTSLNSWKRLRCSLLNDAWRRTKLVQSRIAPVRQKDSGWYGRKSTTKPVQLSQLPIIPSQVRKTWPKAIPPSRPHRASWAPGNPPASNNKHSFNTSSKCCLSSLSIRRRTLWSMWPRGTWSRKKWSRPNASRWNPSIAVYTRWYICRKPSLTVKRQCRAGQAPRISKSLAHLV